MVYQYGLIIQMCEHEKSSWMPGFVHSTRIVPAQLPKSRFGSHKAARHVGLTYQGNATIWCMGANEIMRHLNRSTLLALDIVNGAIVDNHQLKNNWEAFGRRLDNQENALKLPEGFLEDISLSPATDVLDPEPSMENIPDTKH
ncbi:LOW QUALITY PROTEIN: hypothetical protein PHMEG_00020557 [Phytophthora megakarya]|uniref:Uncharacterized protein n=1 Tax=Phytophthora megakarya TaxID=4795 RepID=A0A225VP25_9STRA|nr:LOW QUALITY PROTEIN: hypothetical protein PHMEG_00020557 [Phytophthora megakarya]